MKQLLIITEYGGTFSQPESVVLRVDKDGTKEEAYVSELKPGEDKVLYRMERANIKLSDVIDVLQTKVPGYNDAREFCYIKTEGKETTRLRYDIAHALAAQKPELFRSEELGCSDACIFRIGRDFSYETEKNMVLYLQELLSKNGIKYTTETVENWVNGNTIHPVKMSESGMDFETPIVIGRLLNSDQLTERSRTIATTHGDENKYSQLVSAHRMFTAMISQSMRKTEQKRHKYELKQHRERVFKNLVGWRDAVLEELGSRISENVGTAEIREIKITEYAEKPFEKKEEPHPKEKLHRGIIVLGDKNRADVYEKLRMPKPERRKDSLWQSVEKSFEVCDIAYKHFIDFMFRHYDKIFDNLTLYIDKTAGAIEISYMLPDSLGFLSPLYNYDPAKLQETYDNTRPIEMKALESREFRRETVKTLRKRLPETHSMYPFLSRIYEASLFFRALLEKKTFLKKMSDAVRYYDANNLDKISLYDQKKREEFRKRVEHGRFEAKTLKLVSNVSTMKELAYCVRDADQDVPVEISMFRSFPVVIGDDMLKVGEAMNSLVPIEKIGDSERDVLSMVCCKYGIDIKNFLNLFTEHLVEAAKYFAERRDSVLPAIVSMARVEQIYPVQVKF